MIPVDRRGWNTWYTRRNLEGEKISFSALAAAGASPEIGGIVLKARAISSDRQESEK